MSWRKQAACRDKPTAWFYPDMPRGRYARVKDPYENARPVCAGCPVAAECLDESRRDEPPVELKEGQVPTHGFRAGLRPEERYILFSNPKAARLPLPELQAWARRRADEANRRRHGTGRRDLREKKWSEHQRVIDRERARRANRHIKAVV